MFLFVVMCFVKTFELNSALIEMGRIMILLFDWVPVYSNRSIYQSINRSSSSPVFGCVFKCFHPPTLKGKSQKDLMCVLLMASDF